jgi:hypothetical protein
MRNSIPIDQSHNEAIRAEIADRLGYLLPPPLVEDQIQEQEAHVMRLQMMEQETTDPLAARLLQDIISEMEAELKEQVDSLVARWRMLMARKRTEPMEPRISDRRAHYGMSPDFRAPPMLWGLFKKYSRLPMAASAY